MIVLNARLGNRMYEMYAYVMFQEYTHLFIMDAFVDLFITLCIVVNTFFMALDHHDMDEELARVGSAANEVDLSA